VAAAANAALLHDFRLDLADLIGEPLSDTLLRHASDWSAAYLAGRPVKHDPSSAAVTATQMGKINEGLVLAAIRHHHGASATLTARAPVHRPR
jgi:hypothetical protein